jgi:diguanylate cyclase (GGDEF)-like protein
MVNDSRGHAAGDHVLQEVARRLSATVRRGDTVARFGGDEFVILCENLTGDEVIRVLAERIATALARPFDFDGHELSLSASIGIATSDDWRRGAEELVRDADSRCSGYVGESTRREIAYAHATGKPISFTDPC